MKKFLKVILILGIIGVVAFASVYYYVFLRSHRKIENSKVQYEISASNLISEFAKNEAEANAKYLDKDQGKVIMVTGKVSAVTEENGRISVVLKDNSSEEGGVICYLDASQNEIAKTLKNGDFIKMKGACTGWVDITSEVDLVQCLVIK